MKPRPFLARCCLFLIPVALILQPDRARAERASFRIEIGSHGVATVHFILATLPPKPEALGPLISEALDLRLGEPTLEVEEGKKVVTFDAASRDAFPHRMFRVNGKIDLAQLERFLRDLGIDSMMVTIVHPRGAFSYCSPAIWNPVASGPIVDYEYVAATASGQSSKLEFGFGYHAGDLLRPFILLASIGLLLVGATVWRTRATSSRLAAGQHAARVDYGRFHFSQSFVLGIIIIWGVTVYLLNADEIARFATGVESTLPEIGVVTGLLILLPLLVAMLDGTQAYSALTPAEREEESVCKRVRKAIRGQTVFLFSTGLLAAGIVSLRNGATSKAVEWFVAAAASMAARTGLWAWANSASRVSGSASSPGKEEQIFSQRHKREAMIRVGFALLAAVVLTPVILVYSIRRLQLEDTTRGAIYLGILVATVVLALLITNYGVPWSNFESTRWLRAKLKREGTPIEHSNAVFIGLSPGASPRCYDFSYDWDVGWLFFARERVCYLGGNTRFALAREQIVTIRLADAAPGWWQPRRLQVLWKDDRNNVDKIFSLRLLGGKSLRRIRRDVEELEKQFKAWLAQTSLANQPQSLSELSSPVLEGVSDVGTKVKGRWFVSGLIGAGALALGICVLLDLPLDLARGDEGWAVLFITTVAAAFQMLPYVRYREATGSQ